MRATQRKADLQPAAAFSGSLLTDFDIQLLAAGKHYMLYRHLGAHVIGEKTHKGVHFAVWAPNAAQVSVIGSFNGWDKNRHPMQARWDSSGIWELFVPAATAGDLYKFMIRHASGEEQEKADPFGFEMEVPPHTASRITAPHDFPWQDDAWMEQRSQQDISKTPLSIYELHVGSWRRIPEEDNRFMTYGELADWLPEYCVHMGFTHVEFMPLMEHPFYGSWGYQVSGYYAPSSRYGTPEQLRYLIDTLHAHHIGVILDWVPSHFPGDAFALYRFDGTHLFEHADPREGFHPDWKSYIFNFGRNEVRSFLISNAIYWLREFHVDGLRVDAVASMLYRDYSRNDGDWIPNHLGGRENLEAIAFLQDLNEAIHRHQPGTFTVAEESTAFPGVTSPVAAGGLGFDYKWMMGWMNDTLEYFKKDPLYRGHHQQQLAFSMHYFYTERFILPLSHDEVVHGKGALMDKMPGDHWQQAANLRLLLAYMSGHPGGKLLFMGSEIAQQREWRHDHSLDWHLLEHPFHSGIQQLVTDLNQLYQTQKALYELAYIPAGFEWIDYNDTRNSVLVWLRKGHDPQDYLVFIMNATPQVHYGYRIGVPQAHALTELLNTDDRRYGGSHVLNPYLIETEPVPFHNRSNSVALTLAPLALLILQPHTTGDAPVNG